MHFAACFKYAVKYCIVRKHKTVKLNPKIRDSGVSGIQMWREQKEKERQNKKRAHYEKNREKIIEKVVKARKKSQKAKSGKRGYGLIKGATK